MQKINTYCENNHDTSARYLEFPWCLRDASTGAENQFYTIRYFGPDSVAVEKFKPSLLVDPNGEIECER